MIRSDQCIPPSISKPQQITQSYIWDRIIVRKTFYAHAESMIITCHHRGASTNEILQYD